MNLASIKSQYEEIVALLPIYDQNGNNVCQVFSRDGRKQIQPMTIQKFMDKWLEILWVDLSAQRKWSSKILYQRNLNPILINEKIIFIPIKTRVAIGEKDGCYGYISLNSIKSHDEDVILLHSGVEIPYLSSYYTLNKKIQDAKYLLFSYRASFMIQHRIYQQPQFSDTIILH